ncbi:hypothetical protein K438DRAFT_1618757, partial [Mycena galopus ATCC 62051]
WPLHKDDTLFRSGRPTGLNIYALFANDLRSKARSESLRVFSTLQLSGTEMGVIGRPTGLPWFFPHFWCSLPGVYTPSLQGSSIRIEMRQFLPFGATSNLLRPNQMSFQNL